MDRREFLKFLAATGAWGALPAHALSSTEWQQFVDMPWGITEEHGGPGTWDDVPLASPLAENLAGTGPFQPTWDSLLQYEVPDWYRDAKFGIWAHWSPQCVPEEGDWYARSMYVEGSKDYLNHLQQYGHPSQVGYKDLCAQWTLLNWDPEAMMERYQRAGARLFLALANHHDGFDTWNSRHQAWNAVNVGPRRDVLAGWAAAARNRGLRFGATVHAARNWWWFQVAHLSDQKGPLAGKPYDGRLTLADGSGQWWEGLDPQALYGRKHGVHDAPDQAYVENFYRRTRDLIDQLDPDLLYFDNTGLPLGWGGMNIGAYFYNRNLATRGGKMEAVLNIKGVPDRLAKGVVADYERGVTDQIKAFPWQSETCIGDWHYARSRYVNHTYMKPGEAIHWLVDAVSKNGTFILNIPGRPDGTNDPDEIAILEAIGRWMDINGEAIYSTRPWKIYGEGPHAAKGGAFAGQSTSALDGRDIRYTRSKYGGTVYAIVLGWPEGDQIRLTGLAGERVRHVDVLGSAETLTWEAGDHALTVGRPAVRPSDHAVVFRVRRA